MAIRAHRITLLKSLALLAATSLGTPAFAQDSDLRAAMSGRIIDLTATEGMQPELDSQGNVKAGYFRIRLEPRSLASATECPDSVYDRMPKDQRNQWKSVGGKIVDIVFKRNYLWGIDATISLRPTTPGAADTATVSLTLISIKDPKSGNCAIKVGGDVGGSTISYESFLVPIGSGPAGYSDQIQVRLNSGYSAETDKNRVAQLWNGILKPVAGAIFAPAAGFVGAIADEGQAALIKEMNVNTTGSYPETFYAQPQGTQRAHKIFVKLDFINLPGPGGTPTNSTGGVTIALEYQASVFLRNANFYRSITASPESLLDTTIRTKDGDVKIVSRLPQSAYNQLRFTANTPGLFDGGCATLHDELTKLGLSPVDTSVFLWATASANPAVKDHVWEIPCIKTATTDLAYVGIVPPPPPVKPETPKGRQAKLPELYNAMDNLATLAQLGFLPNGDDPRRRFAPRITLIADEHVRTLLQLDSLVSDMDRDAALALLAKRFSRMGCYGPRSSTPDLILPMRPSFPPALTDTERASAAIMLFGGRDGVQPEPVIATFKFGPVLDPEVAQINTISIAETGSDSSPALKELVVNRRPVSCTEDWMNPIFAK